MAFNLTHPSKGAEAYIRCIELRLQTIQMIKDGKVYLDDGPLFGAKLRVTETTDKTNAGGDHRGSQSIDSKTFQQVNHPVSKLRRESFATISLRGMERGSVRALTPEEIRRLQDIAEGKSPKSAGRVKRKAGFAAPKKKAKRIGGKKRTRRS